jgi:ArsR family transcriptional regulator
MNMRSYKCCTPDNHEFNQVTSLSSILKLVGEPSRLKILCILRKDKHCVCEIEEHVHLSQSLISHHLKDLKDAGLLQDEKQQQRVYYFLTKQGEVITDLLFQIPQKEAKL